MNVVIKIIEPHVSISFQTIIHICFMPISSGVRKYCFGDA
jgi:hypothetical protein